MLHPFSQQISDIFPAARVIREDLGNQWEAEEKKSDSPWASAVWGSAVEASWSPEEEGDIWS